MKLRAVNFLLSIVRSWFNDHAGTAFSSSGSSSADTRGVSLLTLAHNMHLEFVSAADQSLHAGCLETAPRSADGPGRNACQYSQWPAITSRLLHTKALLTCCTLPHKTSPAASQLQGLQTCWRFEQGVWLEARKSLRLHGIGKWPAGLCSQA
jgi:hypothetical protein